MILNILALLTRSSLSDDVRTGPGAQPSLNEGTMEDLYLYLWVVVGVVASLLLPIIWKAAFPDRPLPSGFTRGSQLWKEARPYFLIGLISMLIGGIAFAIVKQTGGKFDHWYAAFLNGYFWDATIQKFKK